ncbi:MAG TPA: SPOR domain-containing protein [Gaiellaceae bacterium]|nr:SPOR domain-containing protein [Gaiellaceae bacterium]
MADDDWRLRVELEDDKPTLLDRLGLIESEADELAEELRDSKLAVTHDDEVVFVYARTAKELDRARALIERELADEGATARSISVEHWLEDEGRWDDDPPGPSEDEEILAEGYAPWEVRIPCPDHRRARELADQLAAEGYGIVRRWRYVIAGCASKEDAGALAERLHGSVEPGGGQVWDALQGHPFAVIGPV